VAQRHVDGAYLASHADIDALRWSDDSGLVWEVDQPLDTIAIAPWLSLEDLATTSTISIGDFALGTGAETEITLQLSELYPGPVGFIAAFSGETNQEFPALASFDSAHVTAGLIEITIHNELGLDLDSVTIFLTNAGAADAFAVIAVPGPIPTGSLAVGATDLAGEDIAGDWQFRFRFFTPGGTILTANDKFVTVIASLPEGIIADQAFAEVEPLSFSHHDVITLSQGHQLDAATFAQGTLALSWDNQTALPLTVRWTAPDLTRDGLALAGDVTIDPHGSTSWQTDLSGVVYDAAVVSAARWEVSVGSVGSAGQKISLEADETVSYTLNVSDVLLASASGGIAATTVSTGPLSAAIDWEDGIGDAGLDDWDLFLEITSTVPLGATVSGRVTTDTDIECTVSGLITAGSIANPTTTRLVLAHDDVPLNPLPRRIEFTGALTYGDGVTTVTIGQDDYFAPRVIVRAGADIFVDGVSLQESARAVNLFDDDDNQREERLVQGELELTITNRFPLGATFTINLAADSTSAEDSPQLSFGPATVLPAETDATGRAIAPVTSTLRFVVGPADVALFERSTIWISESLELIGPGGAQPARIALSDYCDWSAQVHLDLLAGDRGAW
jgi:hypothetical protein